MTNQELAAVFRRIADLLEFKGEVVYKVAAYRRAAETLASTDENVQNLWREGRLKELPNVGDAIAAKIDELERTGHLGFLERLEDEVPPELPALLGIPDVGPKTALSLYKNLGVKTLVELEQAAQAGKIAAVKGLGKAKQEAILRGIETVNRRMSSGERERVLLGTALPAARRLAQAVRDMPDSTIRDVAIVGSIMRGRETVGNINLLAAADDPAHAVEAFSRLPQIAAVTENRPDLNRVRVRLNNGLPAELLAVYPEQWATARVLQSSDTEQRKALRWRARERGYELSAGGFIKGDDVWPAADEAEVYRYLGLPLIPAELREGESFDSVPSDLRLIEQADLRGDLHTHSLWSDGTNTIEDMAFAAARRGYAYMLLTDHSKGLGMVQGLNEEKIGQQRREIDAVQEKLAAAGFGMRLLQGCELEIKADGDLDFDDATLAQFDLVVASLHNSLRQPRERITARLLKAMQNPNVDIIAHPTGRIINDRDPADLDMERIVRAAAELGVVLEINSGPERLDLRDAHIKMALDAGCRFSIDSDAHADWQLGWLELGVTTARRAAVLPSHVVNTLPDADALLRAVQR